MDGDEGMYDPEVHKWIEAPLEDGDATGITKQIEAGMFSDQEDSI